jgi:triacylglycerol lipase
MLKTRSGESRHIQLVIALLALLLFSSAATAACRDAVAMVHGNTSYPSSWKNTYYKLLNNG